MKAVLDVDSYIHGRIPEAHAMLSALRAAIRAAAPLAEEGIGYGMPMYRLDGPLVYFAAHAQHLGFYPGAMLSTGAFAKLDAYQTSKGTLQFPYGTKLPVRLVQQIVRARVAQNQARAAARRPRRAAAASTHSAKPRKAATSRAKKAVQRKAAPAKSPRTRK